MRVMTAGMSKEKGLESSFRILGEIGFGWEVVDG